MKLIDLPFWKRLMPQEQYKEAICLVRVKVPAKYRPLKWNDPTLLQNIEGIGFFGFTRTIPPAEAEQWQQSRETADVPLTPEQAATQKSF